MSKILITEKQLEILSQSILAEQDDTVDEKQILDNLEGMGNFLHKKSKLFLLFLFSYLSLNACCYLYICRIWKTTLFFLKIILFLSNYSRI